MHTRRPGHAAMRIASSAFSPYVRAIVIVTMLVTVFAALTASGCQSPPRPPPVSTDDVIRLSTEGKLPEEIIAAINASGTVYVLRARDVQALLEKGVDDRIVDHMLETRIRDLERYYRAYWYAYAPIWPYYSNRPYAFGYWYCP